MFRLSNQCKGNFPVKIQALHPAFQMPTRGSESAGGYDIYMPEAGSISGITSQKVGLGFAAAVPKGHVALVLPRSGIGFKHGLELNNTCGVIDPDYTGQWFAALRTKNGQAFSWAAGERLLQFIVVPFWAAELERVASLETTLRGEGGLGSTGQ
jgi:dUTP pyrophosphatase